MTKFVRQITTISLIVIVILAVAGCSNKNASPAPEPAQQQAIQTKAIQETALMDNFKALLQKNEVTISEVMKYVDEHIVAVSPTNASTMVIELEQLQKNKLMKLQDKFGDSEAVQKALIPIYKNGLTSQGIGSIQNQEVKDLLVESQNSGYKIETAEGMYFPVIDYTAYKKYHNAVTPDIAAFIDIMAVEAEKTPIKDAALMISWSEIIKRAQAQERFIKDYGNSAKVEDMRQLLKRYSVFAMYGANNTPLFSYDTKQMVATAKSTYLATAFDANQGAFSKMMKDYLVVLNKNDYQLTAEVQEYRNKASEEIR